jgi:hypothetical protein
VANLNPCPASAKPPKIGQVKKTRTIAVLIGLALGAMLLLALSKCRGPYLGSYRFENARLVDSTALARIEPGHPAVGASATFIRIEFTSDQDVEAATGGSAQLYVHADFCPGHDEYRLLVMGPYYDDRSRYDRSPSTERTLPDGSKQVNVASVDAPRPTRDPRTNRYVYTAYIVPTQPAAQFSGPYDLRDGVRDLCLWIDHPGYYLSRSQSDVFVIPGGVIAAALRQAPATP